MNKTLKTLMVSVVIAGSFLVSGCHHSPEQRANWITSKISSDLDLNKDQKAKLDDVKQAFLDIHKAQKPEREKHLEEVKQLILSEHLDKAKAKALMTQRQKMMDENFDPIFAKISAFHDSLTPEQRQKAVKMLEKFESHWEE